MYSSFKSLVRLDREVVFITGDKKMSNTQLYVVTIDMNEDLQSAVQSVTVKRRVHQMFSPSINLIIFSNHLV